MCACVDVSWLKGGGAMGVAYCKKVYNYQMVSQTCTKFSGNICHEEQLINCSDQLTKRGRGNGSGLYQKDI